VVGVSVECGGGAVASSKCSGTSGGCTGSGNNISCSCDRRQEVALPCLLWRQ
jgi:hypothetical protein